MGKKKTQHFKFHHRVHFSRIKPPPTVCYSYIFHPRHFCSFKQNGCTYSILCRNLRVESVFGKLIGLEPLALSSVITDLGTDFKAIFNWRVGLGRITENKFQHDRFMTLMLRLPKQSRLCKVWEIFLAVIRIMNIHLPSHCEENML